MKKPEKKSTMHICLNMDPTSMDSRKNADPCTSTVHFLIYEGLTRINPEGEGELALAQSVDISEDGKTYVFHLKDAVWSDQTPITAYDFEHSWKKTVTPEFGSPCPYLLHPIKNAEKATQGLVNPEELGVKALDEKTLKVELENPTPYFLSLITFCNFYPIPSHIENQNPSWDLLEDKKLIVSGPFRLKKWERTKELVLEKNPDYWDAENVHLKEIKMSIIPHDRTALQMYEQGELDFLTTMTTPLSMEDLGHCRQIKTLQVKPMGGILFCTFNTLQFPFHNKNIRRALALSINRNSIVGNILQLSETAATRCVPPVLDGNRNRDLFPAFSPELAKEHLEKGMKELNTTKEEISKALIFTYESEDLYRKIAQTIQHQWEAHLGLKTKLQEHDRKTLISKHMERKYAVGMDRFFAQYYDPYNILERFKHKNAVKNLPSFDSPDYVRFLDEAARLNDPQERLEKLDLAEEVLMSEMPITPIYHFTQGILISPNFENVRFSPLGNLLFKDLIAKED